MLLTDGRNTEETIVWNSWVVEMPEVRLNTQSRDVVFFFGAGASAPFGIPTMKQFVNDFEEYLNENATKNERIVYADIKTTLEERLGKDVDLEEAFTVIDGIINYSPERHDLLSLYAVSEFKKPFPTKMDEAVCKLLKQKFQAYVREKCIIPDTSFDKIRDVYQDFFNRFALELPSDGKVLRSRNYHYHSRWKIFTTNYDTCLEYYWREVVRVGIDTGAVPDSIRHVPVLRSKRFVQSDELQLFKLHGSINWKVEKRTGEITEEDIPLGRSVTGRQFVGDVMLYPIAEKELYLDPYISMLLRLNRELQDKSVWLVIGYSFNDPVIREIFVRKSNAKKHLILVHPKANQVCEDRLHEMKGKQIPMDKKFGMEETFRQVNHQIMHKFRDEPQYGWKETAI
jgi:hypothetical protein